LIFPGHVANVCQLPAEFQLKQRNRSFNLGGEARGIAVAHKLMTAFLTTLSAGAHTPQRSTGDPYDILIDGGTIVDGTGNPSYRGDVGIQSERIAKVGDLRDARAAVRIKAAGRVVAPGFVDIHNHADEDIEKLPVAQNYVQQGVTTLVGGNCGDSIFPVGEKLAHLEPLGLGVNFGLLAGHATIRKQVMGMTDSPPTADELKKMKDLLARAMEQGALGISTGLYYAPGSYSQTDELIELASVVAQHGGIYASHIRDESDYSIGLVASVKEAIEIAVKAKIPIQIAHLKLLGKPVWGKSTEILDLITQARANGVDVAFDQYPYGASATTLVGATVPRWAEVGGEARMLERLRDPAMRQKIRDGMMVSIDKRGGPEKLFITQFASDTNLEGKNLAEIGEMKGKKPVDAAIDLLLAGGGHVASFSMLQDDLIRIMRSPLGIVASDGRLVEFGQGVPHPRSYGTFPRVLGKYVRDERVLSLEEAVRKMTSAPAKRVGLRDRGVIRVGMVADITIFNAATVMDKATFEKPHQYPVGIDHVIVNGQLVSSNGQWTGVRAGRVLYRHKSFTWSKVK
jgi:N-acyl-D-amino-acid deacylase